MNREQAEKLLAAMIFDDLDEASKAELAAYLQTDDELRDRLADMRMAVKLASDAVNEGPVPVLSAPRLEQLRQLTGTSKTRPRILIMHRWLSVAAVLAFGVVLVGLLMVVPGNFGGVRTQTVALKRASKQRQLDFQALLSDTSSRADGYALNPEDRQARLSVLDGDVTTNNGAGEIVNGAMIRNMLRSDGAGLGVLGKELSAAQPAPPLGAPQNADRTAELLRQLNRGTSERRVATSPTSWLQAGPPASTPAPAQGKEPMVVTQSGGGIWLRDDTKMVAAAPSGGVGGTVTYGWSGLVTPQKAAEPIVTVSPADSVVASDEKPTTISGAIDFRESNKRVPVLGDKPVVGQLFEGRALEVEQSPSSRSLGELHAQEESSVTSRIPEGEEAGAPSPSHFRVVAVNRWVMTDRDPQSTFALDVDTASYALCRRFIRSGFLPPIGAVRMEEFINAFDYAYPQRDNATFAVYAEGARSPFAVEGQDLTLLKIAVKARTVGRDQRRAAHLVFVVDASASMGQPDRLPHVQSALSLLVDKLSEGDSVTLITCANEARLHLESVPARQKDAIRQAIEAIQPSGPTNLMAGLRLGYAMARKAFVAGRINQVVLCSDGVANVGQTEADAVLQEVAQDRRQGISLTCVGVGYGAYNDAFLETLADRGDGRYVFLDSSPQARDVLVDQLAATLQTVARDARIQVEFNPARVRRYRLIGYENRDIEDQRFRDDTVDAGEVGSGQCSTALYELELIAPVAKEEADDLGTVFVRYRNAETDQVEEISRPLPGSILRRQSVEDNPRFFLAAGAARFAEWLRQSEHARHTTLADVQRVLDQVGAALPLDQDVQDLASLAHQAENLPRAPDAASQP
ncbi:MAG: von Willebrand factor type A domain-containing protein [Sedimentisphaerales bacterium]|nr:von Willebrand factor type A domain-containing protein [Sedimentisphaerales bacterium]